MERIYNKLVRDNIPQIIESKNEMPITKILNTEEFKSSLEEKLKEECDEVINSTGDERLEELADVFEILRAMAKIENSSIEKVISIADNKKEKRGGFDNQIFLEKVISEKNK